jgi:hypothetical protein
MVDVARPILLQQSQHRRAPRTTVHPQTQWRILGILAGLEEPEEGVDRIVLLLTKLGQRARWEVDVAGIRLYTIGSFADVRL